MDLVMKVKLLHKEAQLPIKAHPSDLGWDLFCVEQIIVPSLNTGLVKTGIAIQFPSYVGGIIKDRSSVAANQGLFVVAGVIDPNYIGEIMVLMYNGSQRPVQISSGAKIAQLLLMPSFQLTGDVVEAKELEQTDRGSGGFGSSDISKLD